MASNCDPTRTSVPRCCAHCLLLSQVALPQPRLTRIMAACCRIDNRRSAKLLRDELALESSGIYAGALDWKAP
jgi:hypothetical protein